MAITKVSNELIAINAIKGTLIADNAITAVHIATNAVSGTLIADNALTAVHIATDAVTPLQIQADAVTAAKLATNAVVTASIVAGSVTATELGADAVTGAKIADDAIDSEHYTDGSIDAAHLADDAVTIAKMAAITRGSIIAGNASGAPAALALGSNNYVLTSDGTDIAWASSQVEESPAFTGNVTVGGTLGVTGETTLATHLNLGDDDYIKVGAGADWSIHHNASHSIMNNTTGQFQIRGDDLRLMPATGNNDHYIVCTEDGEVQLYYDGSEKLNTLTGGIEITGNMEADNITIAGAQGSDGQVITSTGSGIAWEDAGGSGAALTGSTNNHVTTVTGANAIQGESSLTFNGSELSIDGYINVSGNGGGAIFNDSGADVDFRVESNNQANAFFVDGGTNRIGIQTASPDTILHIENCPDNKLITMAQSGRANHIGNYYSTGSTGSHMNFHVSSGNTNGSSTQRMKLYADGRCQIGYDDHDPIRTLEVVEQAGEAVLRIASINDTYGDDIRLEFASGSNGPSGGGFVQSSIHLAATSTSSSQVLNFRLVDNTSVAMYLNSSGINGTLVGSSDEALKENVEDLSDGTTVIKALRPRIFDWKTDEEYAGTGTGQAGFIAQEVESVFAKAVSGEEGRKGIKIMALLAHAVKAIQELEERIAVLEE